uniref:Minus dominance protein n=1 Tax=Gonium maiaprilis TaxID=671768 RepID=F2ZAE4_9CHLO|nr:minus dominance protein [Gonium maiaprilis]BAK20038.1 minus dominance protein [Gonium maiaprilis]
MPLCVSKRDASCVGCSVYKTYVFVNPKVGRLTLDLHQSGNNFHVHLLGLANNVPLFEICTELKNGRSTEWLKECMDAFLKQIICEGYRLEKARERPSSSVPIAKVLARKADLTSADISSFFHLPIKEASKSLGISTTYLKRICRQLGIPRWPYRKVASLELSDC